MTSTKERILTLADGTKTANELSEILGVGRKRVLKLCQTLGLKCRRPPRRDEVVYRKRVQTIREMAARGMTAVEMAEALGFHEKSIREACNREGIAFTHKRYVAKKREKPEPKPKKRARKARVAVDVPTGGKVSTVAEWIARNGPPPKFEAGTLDQLLHDSFHAVGKRFQRTSGNGSSWRPYLLNGKSMSAVDAIRAANQIRAARGLPLLSEPRRRAA